MCKISFIIPNYNTKIKYLEDCLDSIVTSEELMNLCEIIIVDNNSNKKFFNKVLDYNNKYSNIKVIKLEENYGSGYARNLGIDFAKGKYIYFVDNDDMIVPSVILKMLKIIEENNLNIIFCNTMDIENGEEIIPKFEHINYCNINKDLININKENYPNIMYGWCCWRYLLNKNFIVNNNIRFADSLYAQDVYFTSHLYCKMDKIGVIKDVGYLHRVNTGITRNQHKKEYFVQSLKIFKQVLEEFKYNDILYYHMLYLELIKGVMIEDITAKEYKEIIIEILNLIPQEVLLNIFTLYKNLYDCVMEENEELFNYYKEIFYYTGSYLR